MNANNTKNKLKSVLYDLYSTFKRSTLQCPILMNTADHAHECFFKKQYSSTYLLTHNFIICISSTFCWSDWTEQQRVGALKSNLKKLFLTPPLGVAPFEKGSYNVRFCFCCCCCYYFYCCYYYYYKFIFFSYK